MGVSLAQRRICRRFGVEPRGPEPGSMIGVALSRGPELLPLNAIRHRPGGQSNGWFVWRGDDIPQDRDDFFSPIHLEHAADRFPELVPYLALPPGWGVQLAPGHEDVWYDEEYLRV